MQVIYENSFLKKMIFILLDKAKIPFANSHPSLSPVSPPGVTVVTSLACILPDLSLCIYMPKCIHKIYVVFLECMYFNKTVS